MFLIQRSALFFLLLLSSCFGCSWVNAQPPSESKNQVDDKLENKLQIEKQATGSLDLTKAPDSIRFATFNVSFHRKSAGELAMELEEANPKKMQAKQIAEILQTVRPDVVLLNEFDFDGDGRALKAFQKNYLAVSQNKKQPIEYSYSFYLPVNTGVDSRIDLNGDGETETANDAFGFGLYPGQYGMAVLSKFPIKKNRARSFQKFLWKDMPGHLMPFKPGTETPYYSAAATEVFRLSSKSHWDIPIEVNGNLIHFLTAHPTPPVFDELEDRNGRRNHDEIRMFADYVTPGKASYLYDDNGKAGGLTAGAKFVIAGDMNADPIDGDSSYNAALQLTKHPLINQAKTPASAGGTFYSKQQGEKNNEHRGDAQFDTGDFRDSSVGNLRLDYCLPSKNLSILKSGIFWPTPEQAGFGLVLASDHRLVWIDIK
jgi:endonuclease/exonuclease/phosphatase family metal-dependent hydrolase